MCVLSHIDSIPIIVRYAKMDQIRAIDVFVISHRIEYFSDSLPLHRITELPLDNWMETTLRIHKRYYSLLVVC